ncbi:MAG: helix-turn-helix transcriptional regulator [Planctomycetota bacterium]|nr:helix-turn-helix transcriptional regulator [Planctomycetota bacterium]
MESEKVAVVAQEVANLLGQKNIARPLRDFLLLFLNRVRFEDFEEHRTFLHRITESDPLLGKTLLIAILLAFCRLAKDTELPLSEVKLILNQLAGAAPAEPSEISFLKNLPFPCANFSPDGRILASNPLFAEIAKDKKSFDAIFPQTSLKEGDYTALNFEGVVVHLHIRKKEEQKQFLILAVPSGRKSGEDFCHLLRRLRKQQGHTLVALAEKLSIARGYLHNIERGKVIPSYALMEKAATLLDPDGKEGLFLSGVVAKIPLQYRNCLARML